MRRLAPAPALPLEYATDDGVVALSHAEIGAPPGYGARLSLREDDAHARFRAVFLPYLNDAYRLARWLSGSAVDANDIVQEAAIRALKGVAGFADGDARAWTLTVTRNAAYTWLTRNRQAMVVFADDSDQVEVERAAQSSASPPPTPEAELLSRATNEELHAAIAALPAPFREVLVLREINELDYRTIASVVGIPIGTVMSRLARARALLGKALTDRP